MYFEILQDKAHMKGLLVQVHMQKSMASHLLINAMM